MIDITRFRLANIIDTCAIWNVLSSRLLYSAARRAKCVFACTQYVHYECFHKPRGVNTPADRELQARLSKAIEAGDFTSYPLEIEDLQEVEILHNRKRLSLGEISSIAFAKKTGQAFLTDDQKARKLGTTALGSERVQTTPQLFGWLIYKGDLSDGDNSAIQTEHKSLDRMLARYFQQSYEEALRCRLMARGSIDSQME